MVVLYFHQHFSTVGGSSGTRSYEFAKKLISCGHQVTMVCGSYWLGDSGLKVILNMATEKGSLMELTLLSLNYHIQIVMDFSGVV